MLEQMVIMGEDGMECLIVNFLPTAQTWVTFRRVLPIAAVGQDEPFMAMFEMSLN